MQAQLLDTVTCKFLPHAAVPKCENQIRAGIRHFVEVFEDTVSPSSMCKPLCGDGELYVTQRSASKPYRHCEYCQYAAAQLPEVAGLSDDVDKALLNVCTSLPEPFQEPCRGFMSEYGVGFILLTTKQHFRSPILGLHVAFTTPIHSHWCLYAGQEVAEVVHTSPGTSACTASGLCAISGINAMTEDDIPAELHDALADGFSKIGAMHLQQTCRATDDLAGLEDQECEFCKVSI